MKTPRNKLTVSSKSTPCPVCDRTKDGDCCFNDEVVLCHTFVDQDAGIAGLIYRGVKEEGVHRRGMYFLEKDQQETKPIREWNETEYFYDSAPGKPLVKVKRVDDGNGNKKIFQQHLNGKRWINKLPEQVRKQIHLYRIDDALNQAAKATGGRILIVEGEGKVDLLLSLGIAATCAIGGAGKWQQYGYPNYKQDLAGAKIVLCPDRDKPGIKHCHQIAQDFPDAEWLFAFPQSPLWKSVPDKSGLDIADWVADLERQGMNQDQICDLILSSIQPANNILSVSAEDAIQSEDNRFGELINTLDHIFTQSESAAKQRLELIELSKRVKISVGNLTAIYDDWRAEKDDLQPMSLAAFRDSCSPKRQWLIGGILPKGTTGILHSEAGCGKTLLMYSMAKSIAAGHPWNGFPTYPGDVLIVQTDEPSTETKERFEIAGIFDGVESGQISILSRWAFTQMHKLRQWIEVNRPVLVVIDSLTTVNRRSHSEEKDAPYAHGLLDLRDIADQFGCTIWILHHSNRAGGVRGTTAIDASVSEVWKLRKPDPKENLTNLHRILEVGKSRAECSGHYLIRLEVEDYSWEWLGDFDVSGAHQPQSSAPLLEFLKQNPQIWFEPEELSARGFGGGNRDAVRMQCNRLARKGMIQSKQRIKPRDTGATRFKVYRYVLNTQDEDVQRDVQRENSLLAEDLSLTERNAPGYTDSQKNQSDQPEKNTPPLSHKEVFSEDETPTPERIGSRNGSLNDFACVQREWTPRPGDRVRYIGKSPRIIFLGKVLEVVAILPGGMVEVTFSNWSVNPKVAAADLELVQRGQRAA